MMEVLVHILAGFAVGLGLGAFLKDYQWREKADSGLRKESGGMLFYVTKDKQER